MEMVFTERPVVAPRASVGLVRARVTHFAATGEVFITQGDDCVCRALIATDQVRELGVGDLVLVLWEDDGQLPVIVSRIGGQLANVTPSTSPMPAEDNPLGNNSQLGSRIQSESERRGERAATDAPAARPQSITIRSEQSLMLECGKSSLEMRADGKILLQGVKIVSKAEQSNRIKGGCVNIN